MWIDLIGVCLCGTTRGRLSRLLTLLVYVLWSLDGPLLTLRVTLGARPCDQHLNKFTLTADHVTPCPTDLPVISGCTGE